MAATSLHMQSTRGRMLEYLQRNGRATVKELGQLLGLTATGIRQHLTVLERDGLVTAREERGRVGRPTLVYSLTNEADALFPKTYDVLASVLLEEIRATDGNEKLHNLLHNVAELKEAVGTMFHKSKVSLTGGLLRALQAAHEHLREWNRRSMRDHWIAAGVSCAGVRGHEVYLAQVAPASAVFSRNGETAALRPSLADALEPLGLYDEFWPEFSHFDMQAGDRLLMLTPALADALPPEEPAASLALPPDEVLPSLYHHARSVPDCGAVLLAALDSPDLPAPAEA